MQTQLDQFHNERFKRALRQHWSKISIVGGSVILTTHLALNRITNQLTKEEVQQPVVFPELDDSEPLFSDQEQVLSEPANNHLPSPTRTTSPLLSNPALTDTLSNFPLFSSRAGSSVGLEPAEEDEPHEETDTEDQAPCQSLDTPSTSEKNYQTKRSSKRQTSRW